MHKYIYIHIYISTLKLFLFKALGEGQSNRELKYLLPE